MKVSAMPLVHGVSLTLVHDGEGWRFSGWSRFDGGYVPLPKAPDQGRCFPTEDDAAQFFRDHYGPVIETRSL